jgi:probable O-glycosylation ligase (exosortase A-associated)
VIFAVNPNLSLERYSFYIRMIAILFCIPIMIQTEQHLRTLLLVIILSLGVLAVKFGGFGIFHGGVVLVGGYGNVLDDNNFLALALAMLVPLCWYYRNATEARIVKGILMIIIGAAIAEVLMSNSRGGSLALGLAILLILSRSNRKLMALVILAACVGPLIYLLQDVYFTRMNTLRTPMEDASAASRIVHAKAALAMWADYPLWGVGFGGLNYAALAPTYQGSLDNGHVAHNTYIQMLVDSGAVASLLYMWLLLSTIREMAKAGRRQTIIDPARSAVPYALHTSLAVFALGGCFYSCHRIDLPYMLMMCAACWQDIERRSAFMRLAEAELEPEYETPLH